MRTFLLTIFFVTLFSQSFGQVNLDSGLVAYYPFSGNANDASGNGNNASFNNATLTSDRFGTANSAYSFNGVDNYIKIPNSASLNTGSQISLCVYVKINGFYKGPCHGNDIINKGQYQSNPGFYFMRFDDYAFTNGQNCSNTLVDTIHQNFYSNAAVVPAPGYSPYINKDQWYCLVYTYDGASTKFFIDGALVYQASVSGLIASNTDDLYLGRLFDPSDPNSFQYQFNGVMDEVRIYNRAIDSAEVASLCSSNSCSNWLSTPVYPSYMQIGQLDVTGNQITVEATINRTTPYSGGTLYAGDIVSKHATPADVNYLLRPNEAEITTSNGYFRTPDICEIELNKTYHVAMVYDGSVLKFYRNGFLMSQIDASGNLYQNSWNTRIGYYEYALFNTNFIGYINEVRIWNVARTQSELNTYMNSSLPNPTTQAGLLAYYTFDNLLNKQGNSMWDGSLGGSASINAINPNCTFIADSCAMSLPVTIASFKTTSINKQINLNWNAENEDGIIKYTVERSLTGHSDFAAIGSVNAKKLRSYSFVDNTVIANQNYYYRLAILENTNVISYSEVKVAKITSSEKIIVIYPNPSKGEFTVRINGYYGKATFSILNAVGQIVLNESDVLNDNTLSVKLNNPSKGIYWLRVQILNEQYVEKIVFY